VTKVRLVTGRRQVDRFGTQIQRNSIDGLKVWNSLGKKELATVQDIYITTRDRGERKGELGKGLNVGQQYERGDVSK
jgi:hypothetical protein